VQSVTGVLVSDHQRRRFKPLPRLRTLHDWPRHRDEEILERLTAASGREKLDARVARHALAFAQLFRRWAHSTENGRGRTSWAQIVGELYPDVERADREAVRRKRTACRTYADRLEAAGVLRVEAMLGPDGEFRGLTWRWIDEPVNPELYVDGYQRRGAAPRLAGSASRGSSGARALLL
jgi:hypothetical protein